MTQEFLWQPLLEAAGQTITGAIGSYVFAKAIAKVLERNTFEGPMDLWKRGISSNQMEDGDLVHFDGIISPYTQLFPGNPLDNATRWNSLYDFSGKISNSEYQAMEFFAGSDAALRIGSINGESIVGLYARYGFIGEGLIGVIPTKLINKKIPNFFHPDFFGCRALISGRVSRCPAQHGYVAQGIALKAGIEIDISGYQNLWYLQINHIRLFTKEKDKIITLLGSPWAVTESKKEQYLVQYGYINNNTELSNCISRIRDSKVWNKSRVFFDD